MSKRLILVLGGARSGKSNFALEMATRLGPRITFLATAAAGDEDMRRRIEQHQRERPSEWETREATQDVGKVLSSVQADAVILDCMTLLVSNLMSSTEDDAVLETRVRVEVDGILDAYQAGGFSLIIVSNEVGMGIVPANPQARIYRDVLGRANQRIAFAADEMYLMVAGLPMTIKAQPEQES